MSEYTRKPRSSRHNKKHMPRVLLVVCLMLVVMVGSIAGTVAWLTDKTDEVKNTFTVGDVNITLKESDNLDLKMIPGKTITKDPKVTVSADSEDVWLFVKLTESDNFTGNLSYEMADGWTLVTGQTNVYYYNATITKGTEIPVLKDNQVKVSTEITKTEMAALKTNAPTLTVQAYACQKDHVADAVTAWSYIDNAGKTPTTNP